MKLSAEKDNQKRKRYNVLLNDTEREVLAIKMEKYGYKNLSVYLRDSGIYERLFVEDIEGKTQVDTIVCEYIKTIQNYEEQTKVMLMSGDWTEQERQQVLRYLKLIDLDIRELVKTIRDVLWISTRKIVTDPNKYADQLSIFEVETEAKK